MQPRRVGVYAGSFDPVTFGHLDVVTKAADLVDELHVLVAVNPKKMTWFTRDERVELLRKVCPANVIVASTEGYVVEYAKRVGATWLVRGVRTTTDAAAELELAGLNASLAPEVRTFFVTADPKLSGVSSSGLKTLVEAGAPIDHVCPAPIVAAILERQRERGLQHQAGTPAHITKDVDQNS